MQSPMISEMTALESGPNYCTGQGVGCQRQKNEFSEKKFDLLKKLQKANEWMD